jgi:hypothetical protein
LEFGGGLLLDAENNVIGTANTDGGVTFTNSFKSVLDLEKMAIRGENRNCSIVSSHYIAIIILLLLPFAIQMNDLGKLFWFV